MPLTPAEYYGKPGIQLQCDMCRDQLILLGATSHLAKIEAKSYGWGFGRQYLETEHGTAIGPEEVYCPRCARTQCKESANV